MRSSIRFLEVDVILHVLTLVSCIADFQQIQSEFEKQGAVVTNDVQNRPVVSDIANDVTGFNVQHENPTWKARSGSNSHRMLETTIRKEKEVHPYYGHQEHDARSLRNAEMIPSASVDYDKNVRSFFSHKPCICYVCFRI